VVVKISSEYDNLKTKLIDWLATKTQISQFNDGTIEIMAPVKDALGDNIYCFVTQKTNGYLISDDGRCLFKLDPSASDNELFEEAAEIAANAEFKLNDNNWTICTLTDKENLLESIMQLINIQVAISYLA
jgi:hypothetical protein